MTDYHPFAPDWCMTCGCPDGECTGVKPSEIDLHRGIPTEVLKRISEYSNTYEPPMTLADLIMAEARIGYGGHLDEILDEESDAYGIAARDDRELNGIIAARFDYSRRLGVAFERVAWPGGRPPLMCDRHGGRWGTDIACQRCTYSDGTARPPLDDPGPLGGT